MTRNYRTILPILSAGVAAALIAGCGSGGSGASGGSTGGSDSSGGKDVKVALVVPLTSGNSTYAAQMSNAADLAADRYNSAAGSKCQLTITAYDDKGDAGDATTVTQNALSADGEQVIIGAYTSDEALAIKGIAERQGVVFLSTSSLSPAITAGAKFTFRVSAQLANYPESYAAFAKKIGLTRPAIVADDSPTGQPLAAPLRDALVQAGVTPAGPAVIFQANATSMTATVQQVQAQHPGSIIVLGAVAADQGLLIKTAAQAGLDVPFVGNSAIASPDAQKVAGSAYNSSTIYTFNNTDPSKPAYKAFVAAYTAKFGEDKSLAEPGAQTYDAVTVLGEALNSTDCDASGAKLAAALHALPPTTSAAGGTGVKLSFAGGQDGFENLRLVPFKVVDGQLQSAS